MNAITVERTSWKKVLRRSYISFAHVDYILISSASTTHYSIEVHIKP